MPVVAALSPAMAQVKRLQGLPPVTDRAVATQIVRANVGRFFLRNGVPLSASDAHRSNNTWWGAVMDTHVLLAVEQACNQLRLRLEGCIPTVAALAQLVADGSVTWRDGESVSTITVRRRAWIEVRRDRARESPASCIPAVAKLGPDALTLTDALAAAYCTRRSPLLLRSAGRDAGRRLALRLMLGGSAVIALLGTLLAPGMAASRQQARDEHRLVALRDSTRRWAPVLQELSLATAGLNEIARLTARRRSMTQLLGELAEALPDSSAIVTLRVDSAGGSVTLLSTSAASVIPQLAAVDGIVEPKIAGSVTRETVGAAQLQRVTVRFRFASAQPPRASSP
jgi:hypothetical protein